MITSTTITRIYEAQFSFDQFNEAQEYERRSAQVIKADGKRVETLKLAIATIHEAINPPKVSSWIAFWIKETVTTVTDSIDEDGNKSRDTEISETFDIYSETRTWEAYKRDYLDARAREQEEERQARIASGEEAFRVADAAEGKANDERKKKGEPLVYDAAIAYYDHMGWKFNPGSEIDMYRRAKVREEKSFKNRLKRLIAAA
jgi:DNA repair exonuclease SbcCD nuclease subunit